MTNILLKSQRLVHLDLKGAAPRVDYYEKIFPLFSAWGATGILIEYEDMFPYIGDLSCLRGPCSYSAESIKDIISLASKNNLHVIPLVQTFGHVEFVLKHDCFRHIREVELYPNALCPSHVDSFPLVTELLAQIMKFHPDIQFIHIGADEVWHLGKCDKCINVMTKNNWTTCDLFLVWMSKISKWLKMKFSLEIIVWDDMLRAISSEKLKEYSLGELVQPMIWKYEAKNISFPTGMFERYSEVFESVWAASAFKGGTGSTQFLPPIQHHIDNNLMWISILSQNAEKFSKFQGIVITGWQRYDHYAVLCELLPCSLPCLAFCLRVLMKNSFTVLDHEIVSKDLGSNSKINILPFPRPQVLEQEMTFPGHEIYVAVQMWSNFVASYHAICSSEGMVGWFSDYFRSRNFTNPAQVENIMFPLIGLKENLTELQRNFEVCLNDVFYEDTVEEWIGSYITPVLKKIDTIIKDCQKQIEIGGRIRDYNIN